MEMISAISGALRADGWRNGLLLVLAALLSLNFAVSRPTPIEGDGAEYFLMSQSLLSHASPSLRKADMLAYDRALRLTGPGMQVQNLEDILKLIEHRLVWNGCYFPARNGGMYSYHYWLYPLLNVPALATARLFGFAPSRSFLATNSLLVLIAAFLLLYKTSLPVWMRNAALLMFLTGGTSFYLNWSGPELFSACGVLVGCAMLLSGNPLAAALAFAAGAQQNPPIGVLIAVSFAVWLWRLARSLRNRELPPGRLAIQLLAAAAIAAFALQSPLFYLTHFGVANLIVAVGASVAGLASHHRLISYYFDFDQGLIRAAPFLLVTLIMALVMSALTALGLRRSAEGRKMLALGLACVGASVLIAIPALSTANWVAGCRVFLRYAYWGSVPLWFAAAYFLRTLSPRPRTVVLAIALLGQLLWIGAVYRFNGYEESWLEHSWLTKQIIERYPEHYNPEITIFNVRTSSNKALPFAPYPGNVYYFEHPGRISKLLYHPQSRDNWIPECAATPTELETRSGVTRIAADDNWAYLNLGNNCPLPNEGGRMAFWLVYQDRFKPLPPEGISFARDGNWDTYTWFFQAGWRAQTDREVWLEGDSVSTMLLLPEPPHAPLTLTLTALGAAPDGQQIPPLAVYANGIRLGSAHFTASGPATVTLPLSADLSARSHGIVHIRLRADRPLAPPGNNLPGIGMIAMNLQ